MGHTPANTATITVIAAGERGSGSATLIGTDRAITSFYQREGFLRARPYLTLAAFALLAFVPVGLAIAAVADDSSLADELAKKTSQRVVAHLVEKRIADDPLVRQLRYTALALGAGEIKFVARHVAKRPELVGEVRKTLQALAGRIDTGDERVVVLDLGALRRSIIHALRYLLTRKLANLQSCSVGDDIKALWSSFAGEVKGDSGMTTLRKLPRCRPPAIIRHRVAANVAARIRRLDRSNKVTLFKKGESSTILSGLSLVRRWALSWVALLPVLGLLLLLVGGGLTPRGNGYRRHLRLGWLVLAGLWLALALAASYVAIWPADFATGASPSAGATPLVKGFIVDTAKTVVYGFGVAAALAALLAFGLPPAMKWVAERVEAIRSR